MASVTAERKYVRVELSEETIIRLLAGGQLCAADVHCPDGNAKRRIRRLALESCRCSETGGGSLLAR